MIARGDVYWADLGEPVGSRPAKRRPIVVISADSYNGSRLTTVLVVALTPNTRLASMPGNVLVPGAAAGLPRDSVANVTALVTLNKTDLVERVGAVPQATMDEIGRGLRLALAL